MNDYYSFPIAGSSQQYYQHTYDLWKSSTYYNINDLSARNLVLTESNESNFICDEVKEVVRDSKNRLIISKESLFKPPPEDAEKLEESIQAKSAAAPQAETVNWTSQYWKKAGGYTGPKLSQRKTKQPVQNHIQKKLSKAFSQPINIDDKAANMMAKMGWQGGALGKSGEGIVEPIVPNTDYATRTTGFGQPEPTPKRKQKQITKPTETMIKSEKRKLMNEYFKKNVMLHILDFVKNDYEIEIMFESKLDNHERRKIHNIVDKIGNADTILATADVTVPNIDIFNDIIKYNNYILRTESEGVVPNRTLCIYKEPPAHMYVVTHHDLRYEPEKPAKANKPNTELNVLANESNEQTHHKNEIKEVNETKMDEDNKIILVGSESSCDLHEGEGENNTKSANGHKENEVLSENVALNKETTDVHGENNIIKSKKNKSYHITKKGVIKYRMTKVKVDSKPLMADKKSKFRKVTTEVLAREKNPFLKSIMSVQKCDSNLLTKTDLKNQILEYFREFTSEKLYTEFKFLGSFDEVEAEAINEFIKNLWMCITDGDYLNDEILCIMKDAECGFAIGMHNNGSALIYKTQKAETVT